MSQILNNLSLLMILLKLQEFEDSEPLVWSSPSATDYEFDSGGEEYVPTGKNAKRLAKRLGNINN